MTAVQQNMLQKFISNWLQICWSRNKRKFMIIKKKNRMLFLFITFIFFAVIIETLELP